ncbi:phosphotransferase [Corynebacterium aquilae]|uniref:Phosphotransferase n=1 Tax=Corynebacterium aquilae DSM 44791 TaxID=1431546 RepID=A0A1L7CG94_9CORY|nr:phosphotransferase [Corynebacterium aquilae]APT84858.1 phosphotransferase [Corynebacterium aquilae DSM 44791]
MLSTQDIISLGERMLSERFGGEQVLSDPVELQGSGSSKVIRARVAAQPFLQQRSVVLKYSPASVDEYEDAYFIREVVAYQFTNSLPEDVRPGPVLLGYDIEHRLLVISDAGEGDTLEDLLSYADAPARLQILRTLGHAIGRMHAGTAEREEGFDVLLKRMLTKHPETSEVHASRDEALLVAIDTGIELLHKSGVELPATVSDFAADAKRRLLRGQHRAFSPFDLSPDNVLYANGVSFLDYEWAGFRDATFDVACVIAGFPQFPLAHPISDEEADAFVAAWVHEVDGIWPNVSNGERLRARILTAMIGWALSSLTYIYYGSMNQLATQLAADHVEADHTPSAEHEAFRCDIHDDDYDILAGGSLGSVLRNGGVARRDLLETFQAMQRMAARGGDERFADIEQFAHTVCERLEALAVVEP